MPAKNSIKISVENGYYHIYNRGVNKQNIFESPLDYSVFLNYLKEALSPVSEFKDIKTFEVKIGDTVFVKPRRMPKNFNGEIDLIAYGLMPNHFHFIIKQGKKESMEKFVKSLSTRYSMYFNKAHKRIGPLFQGVYKAVYIENEDYLLHLSRYIHLNPKMHFANLTEAYSSYANYIGLKKTPWLNPSPVLDLFNNKVGPEFKKINNYKDFVEKYDSGNNYVDKEVLENLIIEPDD